jgi:hypothetical protein
MACSDGSLSLRNMVVAVTPITVIFSFGVLLGNAIHERSAKSERMDMHSHVGPVGSTYSPTVAPAEALGQIQGVNTEGT